jgi:hypothetical protein
MTFEIDCPNCDSTLTVNAPASCTCRCGFDKRICWNTTLETADDWVALEYQPPELVNKLGHRALMAWTWITRGNSMRDFLTHFPQ